MSFYDKNMQKGGNKTETKKEKVRQETIHVKYQDCRRGLRWCQKDNPYAGEEATTWEKMALVKPRGSTYARASVQVTREWNEGVFTLLAFNWIFHAKYCGTSQVRGKPSSISFLWAKVVKRSETWNCIHLRFRSVYLGLAKQRQRSEAQPGNGCNAIPRRGTKWWQ